MYFGWICNSIMLSKRYVTKEFRRRAWSTDSSLEEKGKRNHVLPRFVWLKLEAQGGSTASNYGWFTQRASAGTMTDKLMEKSMAISNLRLFWSSGVINSFIASPCPPSLVANQPVLTMVPCSALAHPLRSSCSKRVDNLETWSLHFSCSQSKPLCFVSYPILCINLELLVVFAEQPVGKWREVPWVQGLSFLFIFCLRIPLSSQKSCL